jgi:3-hydroxybutyryl-CoA dehydrogenase
MNISHLKAITVIGAGTMGHGIAAQLSKFNYQVTVYESTEAALISGKNKIEAVHQKAVQLGKCGLEEQQLYLSRLSYVHSDLATAVVNADLVIEAVPEILALKQSLFQAVQKYGKPQCILGSNTSSLSIDKIAEGLERPEQLIGLHFFNPVVVMPLLEIVFGSKTSQEILDMAQAFAKAIDKTSILVKDSPGFATSRLGITLGNEAMRMVEEGVASAKDIDLAMTLGYKHPIGPLALTDLVGLDVRLAISDYLYAQLGTDTFKAPQILRDKVARGELGKKTGKGFYDY